jgi:Predicted ATPase
MLKTIQIGVDDDGSDVVAALSRLNRHSLVAGATGMGKTRTIQTLVEQLSAAGVPTFVADIKSDLSGMAVTPDGAPALPVRFLSLSGLHGEKVETSLTRFGAVFLARTLGLNDTQSSVLAMVFKYCADNKVALDTFDDLRKAIGKLSQTGLQAYGGISPASIRVLLREIMSAESRGLGTLFSGRTFDVSSLFAQSGDKGVINMLELSDSQESPEAYSTYMLWLLAEIYRTLPEVGDLDKPKLVFFFDEAHLLFNGVSKVFMDKIEQVVRLIRSKGVGICFITQSPTDIPRTILGQLGNRIQHALRAFTPDDEQAIRLTARTFPKSAKFDIADTLTTMAIGEALVTVLDEKGSPTEPALTRISKPQTRMGALTDAEWVRFVGKAPVAAKVVVKPVSVLPEGKVIPFPRKSVERPVVETDETESSSPVAGMFAGLVRFVLGPVLG